MRIGVARKQVWLRMLVGAGLVLIAAVNVLLGGLQGIHAVLISDTSILAKVSRDIANLIYLLYVKTGPFLERAWQVAPVPDFRTQTFLNVDFISHPGNIGWAFFIALGVLGRMIWQSGTALKAEIRKSEKEARGLHWQRELGAASHSGDQFDIVVHLPSDDEWFKRPLGMIVIGVAITALAQWVNLRLGLATL